MLQNLFYSETIIWNIVTVTVGKIITNRQSHGQMQYLTYSLDDHHHVDQCCKKPFILYNVLIKGVTAKMQMAKFCFYLHLLFKKDCHSQEPRYGRKPNLVICIFAITPFIACFLLLFCSLLPLHSQGPLRVTKQMKIKDFQKCNPLDL